MGRAKRAPTPADFTKWVRKLGRLVVAHVNCERPPKRGKATWASAFILARWTSDSDSPWMLSKLRGTLATGQPFSLQTTQEMADALRRLWELRAASSAGPWWGLRVNVSPDGTPALDLDPDPNCAVDPLWFKS